MVDWGRGTVGPGSRLPALCSARRVSHRDASTSAHAHPQIASERDLRFDTYMLVLNHATVMGVDCFSGYCNFALIRL